MAADRAEDPIGLLTRLRQDPGAEVEKIITVLQALRDLTFAAPPGQRRAIRVGDKTLGDAVPQLLGFLRDADMEVVEWACQVLGHMGARESIPDLLDLLRPEAREQRGLTGVFPFEDSGLSYPDESAMYALQLMGATDTVPDIVRCLVSDNERTRYAAGTTLMSMQAVPQVALVLAHPDAQMREAARRFLASASIGTSHVPALEAALLTVVRGGPADARRAAMPFLERYASIDAVLPLLDSLESSGEDVDLVTVTRAAIAQIQSRQPGAAPGQVSMMHSESGQISVADDKAGPTSLVPPAPIDEE